MTNTELSLDVSNSHNEKVIRLYDTSFYYKDEPIDNYLIEILPVNKTLWLTFNVTKGFSLVLNSSNLRYKKTNDNEGLIPLPDGIYEIKQSHTPNSQTVSHTYYFRTTVFMNKLESEKNKLFTNVCSLSRNEYNFNRDRLRDLEEYLYAAKWIIEECNDKVKGKDMFEFSKKLLENYTNECKC